MINICVCGGGNLGHVVSGYVAAKDGYQVSVLTRHPERWNEALEIALPDGKKQTGQLKKVTNDSAEVIPTADIVIVCLPGMYIKNELKEIKPYLSDKASVGSIVGSTGFFFQAHEIIPEKTLFSFQRVPFISRITEYGHKANLLGFKSTLNVVIENSNEEESLRSTLADMFDTPVNMLDNFYEVSLSNSNPLLHTSRLYSMWHEWHEGIVYRNQPMFYEGWTVDAAQLYIDMDKEFQQLLHELNIKKGAIPPVLDYYESHDAQSLCDKIRSIEAFKGIKSPMKKTESGWIPDLQSRYFTEDFGYGLRFIFELIHNHNLAAPNINRVYEWGKNIARLK